MKYLALVAGDPLIAVTAGIDALSKLDPGEKAVKIWESNAQSGNNGNFQIATSEEDMDGNVTMSIMYTSFKTKVTHHRFLFWSYDTASIDIKVAKQTIVLNEDVYALVRSQVIQKLGTHAVDYIADLAI